MPAATNFSNGVLNGLNGAMSFLDKIDARHARKAAAERQQMLNERNDKAYLEDRARQQTLDARVDESYEHNLGRRSVLEERGDRAAELGIEQAELGIEQGEQAMQIAGDQNARQAARHPALMRMDGLIERQTLSEIAETNMRTKREAQAHHGEQVRRKVDGIMELLDGGDIEEAMKLATTLEEDGYPVAYMQDTGGQDVVEAIKGLHSGEFSIDDLMVQQAAIKVLGPAFKQSGRDGAQLELAGIQRPEDLGINSKIRGVVPMMRERSTGKIVPATDGISGESGDEITIIPFEQFQEAASSFVTLSRAIKDPKDFVAQIRSIGAQVGGGGPEARANAAAKSRRGTGTKAPKLGGYEGTRDQQLEALVESYDNDPTGQSIATLRVQRGDANPETLPREISEIIALREQEGGSIQEAERSYESKKMTAKVVSHVNEVLESQGVDEKDRQKIIKKALDSGSINKQTLEAAAAAVRQEKQDVKDRAHVRQQKREERAAAREKQLERSPHISSRVEDNRIPSRRSAIAARPAAQSQREPRVLGFEDDEDTSSYLQRRYSR